MYLRDIGEDHSDSLVPRPLPDFRRLQYMAKQERSYVTHVRPIATGMYQPLRTALSTVQSNYSLYVQTNYNKLAEQSRAQLNCCTKLITYVLS